MPVEFFFAVALAAAARWGLRVDPLWMTAGVAPSSSTLRTRSWDVVKEGSSCSKTMALPCGAQDGLKSRKFGSPVSRRSPSPSAPIIQISELGKKQPPPPQNGSLVSKAILSPLGDQSGKAAPIAGGVSLCTSEPSAFIT